MRAALPTAIVCAFAALWSLAIVLRGSYHLYWLDFKASCSYACLTVWNLLAHSWRLLVVLYKHQQYIERNGLKDYHGLTDIYGKGGATSSSTSSSKQTDNRKPTSANSLQAKNAGNPSHFPIAYPALELMWKHLDRHVPYSNAIFVDFGCGVGTAMLTAMQRPFQSIIGVELDPFTAHHAELNVQKFAAQHADKVRCQSAVTVTSMNMTAFRLPAAAKTSTVVLFMYEPLWTMTKAAAYPIYSQVLKHMHAASGELVVAYFFAGKYSGDASTVLQHMAGEVLCCERYPSLYFGADYDLTITTMKR